MDMYFRIPVLKTLNDHISLIKQISATTDADLTFVTQDYIAETRKSKFEIRLMHPVLRALKQLDFANNNYNHTIKLLNDYLLPVHILTLFIDSRQDKNVLLSQNDCTHYYLKNMIEVIAFYGYTIVDEQTICMVDRYLSILSTQTEKINEMLRIFRYHYFGFSSSGIYHKNCQYTVDLIDKHVPDSTLLQLFKYDDFTIKPHHNLSITIAEVIRRRSLLESQ